MWDVRGADAFEKTMNRQLVKGLFEGLRGRIPGMRRLEVGIDTSGVDYACDVVLVTEFESRAALAAYATHPDHVKVRAALGDIRVARHQVDFESA